MKLADIHVTPNYCNTLGLFFEVQVLLRISFMAVNYLTNPFLSYILKLKKKTIVYNSCTSQTVNVSEDLSCASILIHQTVHSDIATNRYTSATVNILIYIYTLPCQYSSEATVIFCIHCHVNAKSSNKIKEGSLGLHTSATLLWLIHLDPEKQISLIFFWRYWRYDSFYFCVETLNKNNSVKFSLRLLLVELFSLILLYRGRN